MPWLNAPATASSSLDTTVCPTVGDGQVISDVDTFPGFPGFAVAANGDYVTIYRDGTSHASNDGQLFLRRSTDRGATWTSRTAVFTGGGFDWREGCLLTLADGRMAFHGGRRSDAGGSTTAGAFWSVSADNGATWSSAATLPTPYSLNNRGGSPIVEDPVTGRLWTFQYGLDSGTDYSAVAVYSDNGGTSWTVGATVADGPGLSRNWAEPGGVRLPSGRLVVVLREVTGATAADRWVTVSDDDGATWSAPVKVLDDASGWPRPILLDDGRLLDAFRDVAVSGWPHRLTVSNDGGQTWERCALFGPTDGYESAYHQMALERTRGVAVVVYVYEVEDGVEGDLWVASIPVPTVPPHFHHLADILDYTEPDPAPATSDETVFSPAYTVDTTGGVLDVALTVVWGVDGDGDPYHNTAGVTAGQEAVLVLNNLTGEFSLRPIEV